MQSITIYFDCPEIENKIKQNLLCFPDRIKYAFFMKFRRQYDKNCYVFQCTWTSLIGIIEEITMAWI